MQPNICVGDMVLVKEVGKNNLNKGDIISFKENGIVITHRITEVVKNDEGTEYKTKGDNNNSEDENTKKV